MASNARKFCGVQGKVPPGHIRSLQESAAKKGKGSNLPKTRPRQDEPVEHRRRVQKGSKPPQTAPLNPMFHQQSVNSQLHPNGNTTRERLQTPSLIQSPESERRVARRERTVLPTSSPLDDNFLNTPIRKSPRLNRSRGVQRNLEAEYDNQTSVFRELSNQPRSKSPRKSASQPSQQSQQNALRSSVSQLSQRSQRQNSLRNPHPSRSASNSPLANNEEVGTTNNSQQQGEPSPTKRGPTTNLAVSKRGKTKVGVDIFKGEICGYFKHQCINSIGSWVRQRDNCPLQYDEFDDLPDRGVDRVIQNVRDHFILNPDDDNAVQAIKKVMRGAYKRHRYRIHKKYEELVEKFGSHRAVLPHPPKNCSNKQDWLHMCTHFTKDAFKNKSARGHKSAASKKINHSSGNKSHTSIEYELVQDGKPCDPLILFELTHDPEKMKSKFKENLKNMKGEMDKMKEAANKGEISDSPEEIYYKCRNAGGDGDGECLGKRRRKAPQTHYSLYQKKEKETAELKVRLAAVEKENKRLKKQTGPDAMKKWLNAYLAQQGMPLIELPVENDAEHDSEDDSDSEDDVEDDAEDDSEDVDMQRAQIDEHEDDQEGEYYQEEEGDEEEEEDGDEEMVLEDRDR